MRGISTATSADWPRRRERRRATTWRPAWLGACALVAWPGTAGADTNASHHLQDQSVPQSVLPPHRPDPPPISQTEALATERLPLRSRPETDQEWGWNLLPVGTYAPETKLGLGVFAAVYFPLEEADRSQRLSTLAGVGLVTTREQLLVEFISEFYWDYDRYRLWADAEYSYYPNACWGVGPRAPASAEKWFTENGPRLQVQLRRHFYGKLYLEARADAQFTAIEGMDDDGGSGERALDGLSGGTIVGAGPTVGWDSRDNALAPHRGGFYELGLLQFHDLLFSDYNFTRLELNLRRYIPITGRQRIAAQVYGERVVGAVPFYRLPMLGGPRLLRSYFEGRYRDRVAVAVQAEYRVDLLWRLGAVAFAGVGEVGPRLFRLPFNPFKWSLGAGLRYRLSDSAKVNIRVDFAFGYDAVGLYAGVGEAF